MNRYNIPHPHSNPNPISPLSYPHSNPLLILNLAVNIVHTVDPVHAVTVNTSRLEVLIYYDVIEFKSNSWTSDLLVDRFQDHVRTVHLSVHRTAI